MAKLRKWEQATTHWPSVRGLQIGTGKQLGISGREGLPDPASECLGATGEARHLWPDLTAIARTVEGEVIPRMLLAHKAAPGTAYRRGGNGREIEREDVAAMLELVLSSDDRVAIEYCHQVHEEGASLETIFIDLLSAVARELGELWDSDQRDFAEVTIGLWRLQAALREFSPAFGDDTSDRTGAGRAALLAAAPGDQHTFGVAMVSDFFRRAGWDVSAFTKGTAEELEALVRTRWFDLVGLSCGTESQVSSIGSLIHSLRHTSKNGHLAIMVGGQLFAEDPELASRVGADATASDARQAPLQAENLLLLMAAR